MTTFTKTAAALGMLCAAAGGAAAFDWTKAEMYQNQKSAGPASMTEKARNTISIWPDDSQLLAKRMLDELGSPEEVMPHYVTWLGRKPFNTITVYADRASSNQPGILLQTVSYRVPVGKWRALSTFGHGVTYDVVFNELVAVSDSPETNLLSMNLADEVIQGRRDAEDARSVYDKTLTRSYAGRSSFYMSGLQFNPSDRVK
jgi:hypothetical protein